VFGFVINVLRNLVHQLKNQLKQNKMSQETLEEIAANLADPNLCKTDNWIAGAKWMLEKLQNFDTWKEWKNTDIIKSEQ
jgi:hypothetical protein